MAAGDGDGSHGEGSSVTVDASEIDYCDGSGIALFVHLRNLQRKAGGQLEIHGCALNSRDF